MQNIIKKIKKDQVFHVALVSVFVCAAFLRVYHFSSWMHFELDQARDVFVIYDSIDRGFEHLPLLGPQARGRELYLGPIFYYFQYGSAVIFGVSPESAALPDLIFSLLAVPLFYFFARLFFSRTVSLMLTSIVSVSLFLIVYGRFAWNPNAMFFWSLVAFYGILRAWDGEKFYTKWFLLAVAGLAIVTQLHFVAFIAAPLTFFVYAVISRMQVPWKAVISGVLLGSFLYMPVIISDVKNDGQNIKAFFASITMSDADGAAANTASDRKHDIFEQTFRAMQETGTFYWHIVSGDNHGRYNIRTKKSEQGYFPLICDEKCKRALPYHITAIFAFMFSFIFFLWFLFEKWRLVKRQKHNITLLQKRNSYTLIFLWLLFSGIFYVMIAYQISPRFYLFVVAPFFIIFGVFLEFIYKIKRIGPWLGWAIVSFAIIANVFMCIQYFSVLRAAEYSQVKWRDMAMNRSDIVTLGQLRRASEYMDTISHKKFVIVGDNRYARALYYLLLVEKNNDLTQCYMKRSGFELENVRGVPYYLLVRTRSKTHIDEEMRQYHEIVDQKQIGTITLYKMNPIDTKDFVDENIDDCFVR